MYLTPSRTSLKISCALVLVLCTTVAHAAGRARILIYSRTIGFRHDSIPTAISALQTHGQSINVDFDATEDPAQFTDGNLAQYDSLLFLSTTGDVLDNTGASAFQKYLNQGGTFVGIHSASDTLRNQTFYANELGALFDYHPVLQNFTVNIIGPSHPSTNMLPTRWTVQDEAYNFDSDPRAVGATVILSADESTYTGMYKHLIEGFEHGRTDYATLVDTGVHKNQGSPHPTAWFQEQGAGVESGGTAGRSFYTSLGHLNETWQDELFMSHILGGISWVLQGNTTRANNAKALVGNPQPQPTVASQLGGATTLIGPEALSSQTPAATESQAAPVQTSSAETRSQISAALVLISVTVFMHFMQIRA